jgi:hypothetical protein
MVLRDFYGIAFWFGLNLQMVDFMREKKKKKKKKQKNKKKKTKKKTIFSNTR